MMVAIQFKFDPEIIAKAFGRPLPLIAGGMTEDETTRILARWDRRELDVLLVHPTVVASGLNMQKGGHNLIYYAMTTSLEDYEQLIGRLRRRDQTASCIYVNHIVFDDSIDQHIVQALQAHAKTQQDLLDYLQRIYT